VPVEHNKKGNTCHRRTAAWSSLRLPGSVKGE